MKKSFKNAEIAHRKYIDTTEFAPLIIYIGDSINRIVSGSFKDLSKTQKDKFYEISQNTSDESFKIDLTNISINPSQYILKYKSSMYSTFQELINSEYSKVKHKRQQGGVVEISRIRFNKDFSEGVFWSTFYCGKLCGCNYTVFIKKKNNLWTIDTIINNGCA